MSSEAKYDRNLEPKMVGCFEASSSIYTARSFLSLPDALLTSSKTFTRLVQELPSIYSSKVLAKILIWLNKRSGKEFITAAVSDTFLPGMNIWSILSFSLNFMGNFQVSCTDCESNMRLFQFDQKQIYQIFHQNQNQIFSFHEKDRANSPNCFADMGVFHRGEKLHLTPLCHKHWGSNTKPAVGTFKLHFKRQLALLISQEHVQCCSIQFRTRLGEGRGVDMRENLFTLVYNWEYSRRLKCLFAKCSRESWNEQRWPEGGKGRE